MKKSAIVINTALIISVFFNVIQYYSIKNAQENYSDKGTNESGINYESPYFLKEVPSLYLHSHIEGIYSGGFSAVGSIANINPYCINNNIGVITILGGGDEHFTKISIEGYIPTWYLTENKSDINYKHIETEKYIIKETTAYYGASENSGTVEILSKGTAIKVIGESNDWYYISPLSDYYSLYPEMWVNKDDVGDFTGDVINTDVRVQGGTKGIFENYEGRREYILDRTMVGTIRSEDDNYYYVTFPGAFGLYLEKDLVEFIGQ